MSSFESVLVHLDPRVNLEGVLDVALEFARRHQAHLVGLMASASMSGQPVSGKQADAVEQRFRERAMQFQVSHDWSRLTADHDTVLSLQSRTHDMLILGQADPKQLRSWPQVHHMLESTLIKSGHPLIAVPYRGSFSRVGERVLVAWNGAREAARAVEDAMAILEKADEVIVLTVDVRSGDATSVNHLINLLERHGVNVAAEGARSSGNSVGQTMLAHAQRLDADLLVMGGYGHAPILEHLFGGATYHVIEHMTLPVLLSH